MRITVLAGGVGGARFALGLRDAAPDADIRIVANVGDDVWLAGVKVCPDLDSLLYALAGVGDTERGWGRAGESERVAAELTAYGVGWPWFTLGDLDLGTHLARTAMLRDGATLTEATARLAARWHARRDAAAGHRRRGADARGDRRGRRPALRGVVGAHARAAAGAAVRAARARALPHRAGGARGDRRRRRDPGGALEPGRVDRHDRRDPRGARRARDGGGADRRASPPSSAARVVRGMAATCLATIGVEADAARRSARTTARGRAAGCSTAGSWPRRTPTGWPASARWGSSPRRARCCSRRARPLRRSRPMRSRSRPTSAARG